MKHISRVLTLFLALHSCLAVASTISINPSWEQSSWYNPMNGKRGTTKSPIAGNVVGQGSSVGVYVYTPKFTLPADPVAEFTSAILTFSYTHAPSTFPLLVAASGNLLGYLPKEGGTIVAELDVTDYVRSVYQPGQTIDFVVRSGHEESIWTDSVEFKQRSLTLTYSVPAGGGQPTPVPEPDSSYLFVLGLALLGATALMRKKAQ
jgi:hypothetical protein